MVDSWLSFITKNILSIHTPAKENAINASCGTMCAFLLAFGSSGLSILHSCVDSSLPPSGWLMLIGFSVLLMLIAGAPDCRTCPVAPASTIPKSLLI